MFSTGQLIFAIIFVIAFSIFMVVSYRKDIKLHQKNYKGSIWVLICFVVFIIVLFLIKYFLKN